MEHKFYTIDQIAEMLGMHHKTIRKFIADGKLGASKVGKQWRISGHDLSVFMEKDHARTDYEKQKEPLSISHAAEGEVLENTQRRINTSAVIDIHEMEKEEYMRLSNTLIAVANSQDPEMGKSSTHVKFDEKEKRVSVILWGSIKFIENMLSTISMLVA